MEVVIALPQPAEQAPQPAEEPVNVAMTDTSAIVDDDKEIPLGQVTMEVEGTDAKQTNLQASICSACKNTFPNDEAMFSHWFDHDEHCGKKLCTEQMALKARWTTKWHEDEPHPCNHCWRRFKDDNSRLQHEEPCRLKHAQKRSSAKKSSDAHEGTWQSSTGNRQYSHGQRQISDGNWKGSSGDRRNAYWKDKEWSKSEDWSAQVPEFSCGNCQKKFHSEHARDDHERQCGKSTQEIDKLWEDHEKKVKRYQCSVCCSRFASEPGRDQHSFTCGLTGEAYESVVTKAYLEANPCVCPVENCRAKIKRFKSMTGSKSLKGHMMTWHADIAWESSPQPPSKRETASASSNQVRNESQLFDQTPKPTQKGPQLRRMLSTSVAEVELRSINEIIWELLEENDISVAADRQERCTAHGCAGFLLKRPHRDLSIMMMMMMDWPPDVPL